MNKAKFTLYTLDYPPNRGGVASYLFNLVRASEGGILVRSNIERSFWKIWPKWVPVVFKMKKEPKGRIILVSHVLPLGTAAWISKTFGGPDYAVIFHGLDIRNARAGWKKWLLQMICSKANQLIVNSNSTKQSLSSLLGESSKEIKILHPALPINDQISLNQKNLTLPFHSKQKGEKIILSICRLVPRKGIDMAIRAMKGVNARYVVIGDGPDKDRLESIAKSEGVPVEFIGDVNDYEKNEWLKIADVFLLPVRDEGDDVEGFGIVYLEAAAASIACIAGKSGGAIEAVNHNETGIHVDPENVEEIRAAITDLLEDEEKRTGFGKAGRVWATKFSWKDNWKKLTDQMLFVDEAETSSFKGEIGIVIPCFNHAYILRRTLMAVLCQSLQPREIIVVDDGSSDNPEKVVEEFKDWLPIRFVRLEKNNGAPVARNVGFSHTTSEFIIFLDADAELAPEALEKMFIALGRNQDASYSYSSFLWGSKRFNGMKFNPEHLKHQNYIHTSSLIRRNHFPGFDEALKTFQDWDLWLTMLDQDHCGVWIDESLYRIEPRGKEGISRWLPQIMYRIPWESIGIVPHEIQKYREAERIVKSKHGLL